MMNYHAISHGQTVEGRRVNCENTTVLGLDPGVATTGWGVLKFSGRQQIDVVDYGVISTSKEDALSARLLTIYEDLTALIGKFKPDYAGVETLLFCNNAKTAISVGAARGILLLCLQQSELPIYEFTPLQIKNNVSGWGGADKKQVQKNVKLLCNMEELPKSDDAADALAVAICAYNGQIATNNK